MISISIQAFNLQKAVQLAQSCGMAHLAKRLGLNLADAFARDIKLLANLFQRAGVAVAQTKTQFQNLPLPLVQTA